MGRKTVRVFVGNLPSDTIEEDVKYLFRKYATVSTVEMKRRTNDVFAFVDLKDLKIELDTCFQELSRKQWKGQQLKIQVARESFLQRLARERLENNVSVKEENVSLESQHNINYFNKDINSCNDNVDNSKKRYHQKISENEVLLSTDLKDSDSDSSETETPKKGRLPMFCGTTAIFREKKKPREKISELNSSKISTNKINEEREILEKFEMFNGVWKDEPSEIALEEPTNLKVEKKFKKQKVKHAENRNVGVQEDGLMQINGDLGPLSARVPIDITQIKQAEAEERRLKAIAQRKKEILSKKQVVQFALASVDSRSNVNRPNKKIIFTDDNVNEEESRNGSSSREPKLTLFSDDEMEQEIDNENDFRIRKHYEGEKGQSLLSLQARYGNDKRFTLDERFIDSDNEQEGEKEVEHNDTEVEREKFLRILGNVLGEEIPDSSKTKPKPTTKVMLRYDPSKPDHTKFEIKKEASIQKLKKKKITANDNDEKSVALSEVVKPKDTEVLPTVSKERYYEVSETLRETLENKDQKFSFSAIFGEANENENEKDSDVNLEAKPIIKTKEWPLKSFQNDSSASEDETNDQNVTADQGNEYNVGVKQESLFFEKDDARFAEGLEFINFRNEEYVKNFDEIRHRMKNIIKHKVQNHKKNSERWRTKYGGRMKNSSSARRLKTNFRR